MKKQFVSKFTAFAAAVLICCGSFLINSNARAQCNCISISHSIVVLCDTCWDSIYNIGTVRHPIWDTAMICDTCWTFALTNNCPYGISAIQIYDSIPGGGVKMLHHGCAVVQNLTEDTNWYGFNQPDGSILFADTSAPSGGCWESGQTLLISICNPLHVGDAITMEWWLCSLPPPPMGTTPIGICPIPPGETLIVP